MTLIDHDLATYMDERKAVALFVRLNGEAIEMGDDTFYMLEKRGGWHVIQVWHDDDGQLGYL